MRVTSLKNIYFTSSELKEALIEYLRTHYGTHMQKVIKHMRHNECTMDWSESCEFMVSINEELEDGKLDG
jgi:hypothetical protein